MYFCNILSMYPYRNFGVDLLTPKVKAAYSCNHQHNHDLCRHYYIIILLL